MRILLVEDDPRMSALLDRGFKEEGHVVDRTPSGSKALDAVGAEEFDVVVTRCHAAGVGRIRCRAADA